MNINEVLHENLISETRSDFLLVYNTIKLKFYLNHCLTGNDIFLKIKAQIKICSGGGLQKDLPINFQEPEHCTPV